MAQGGTTRPSVLDNASETQMQELEEHFTEGNHEGWNTLTNSYGWSKEDSDAVWTWFGEKPEEGAGSQQS